jgi:hypothetical protein
MTDIRVVARRGLHLVLAALAGLIVAQPSLAAKPPGGGGGGTTLPRWVAVPLNPPGSMIIEDMNNYGDFCGYFAAGSPFLFSHDAAGANSLPRKR